MPDRTAKPRRRNLSTSISDDLLVRIRQGELPPGTRLPTEREFMDQYGVGRNTVREAIQALVAMGVIEVRPRVGARVLAVPASDALETATLSALLTGQAVGDIYDLRLVLETEIAKRAATVATADDIERVNLALEDYDRAFREDLDPYRADVAFHGSIARASHNVAFSNVLEAAGDLLLSARRLTDRVPGTVSVALKEHTAIADAITRRDPELAYRTMHIHMETSVRAWQRAQRLFGIIDDK
ncbi:MULTISPECIES: FadR/GntR family transcriptional regulator [Streptomyces]|uniref:FadR/GntR family transcriptional regulator n=1 Tax=Streptomyces lycopersici TaxID=2974589 RepID=UPI0021D0E470|nr:FadR/GntR family transcriptional regulator [Streptomyces sp. NEAU-383]